MDEKFEEKALHYHSDGRAGKTAITVTKPCGTPQELSLAYTPGVAAPAIEINKDRWKAYRYTNKGNLVAVISNGSSVLGLGNIGALAAKPVMEGKAMLFKKYADIDAFDIEIAEEDPQKFIATVQSLAPTFGGINLEDIKAPECFVIEERLRGLLDIPVLHDDQHGTAVTVCAALINACLIAEKELTETRIVICGAGSAAISTARMLCSIGVPKRQITMVDSKGVINMERKDLNSYKAEFVTENGAITLQQAMHGADIFIGLSRGGTATADIIMSMAERPIIFALANPIPEIGYRQAKQLRPDAVVATGRSDSPNQVNNLLAFPYLFRGALDTLSATINEKMKIAAAHAIADIAREGTPKETEKLYGKKLQFGDEYILPKPGDKRLLYAVSSAVAKAAMESGVARRGIASFKEYCGTLTNRLYCENHFYHETIRHRAASKQRNRHQRLQEF